MARKIRPTCPKLAGKKLEAYRAKLRVGPPPQGGAFAREAERAAAVDRFAIPLDLSIPAFLKRAA
jgi:hypothetical protein